MSALDRMRSCPRVYGTTQKLQKSLQPSMMVTYAFTGSPRLVTPSGNVTSSYGLRSRSGARRRSAACSTSIGSRRIACVPMTTSATPGDRLKMAAPSCCATQPATATIGSCPCSAASSRSSPRRVYSFSSARSRTLQVLMTTTSASAASAVASKPACSSSPAIRSESWKFIWQPNVSMRYLRATPTFRFRSFAFAFRLRFAFRLPAAAGLAAAGCRFASISRAEARRPSVTVAPPSIRPSSSTRPSASSRDTDVRVRPRSTRFSIAKCVSAHAAICGRCVMQST